MVAPIRPERVEYTQLQAVDTPKPTETWSPLQHHTLYDAVKHRLEQKGFEIADTTHLLSHEDNRYFGTVCLKPEEGVPYARMVGIRNSHDKRFCASIVAGARVICCANGMFVGDELALSRKHTSRIHDDLPQKIDESFGKLLQEWKRNDMRLLEYQATTISDMDANDLIIRSLDNGAIASSAIPEVLKQYREPPHEQFKPRTLWSLHNAFTEVLKKHPLLVSERSRALQKTFDEDLILS